jgi:lipopolysaccharide/colanic/teichoic acid biosynthesis glycosyltransferase
LDVQYVERRSHRLDTWILLKTIPAVCSSKGAY